MKDSSTKRPYVEAKLYSLFLVSASEIKVVLPTNDQLQNAPVEPSEGKLNVEFTVWHIPALQVIDTIDLGQQIEARLSQIHRVDQ